jgi:site-specific DNA-methyltransferase (adenine-specific)
MIDINTIHTGDSLDLLKLVDDNSIDLHITSPPYADMKKYKTMSGIHPDKYVEWFMPFIFEVERTLKPTGNFVLNINDKVVDGFRHPYVFDLVSQIHKRTGLKMFERLFWDKGKYLPHRSRFGDRIEYLFWFARGDDFYFDIDSFRQPYDPKSIKRMEKPIKKRFARTEENQDATEYKDWKPNPKGALPSSLIQIGSVATRKSQTHVAMFPEKLIAHFINGASKPGDLVCDIFSGSGTTCRVAKRLNRQYLGMELSQEYNDEALLNL